MTPTKSWEAFDDFLCLSGFGAVEHEHRFHPTRKWRFDWALPERMIAFEYDGLFGGKKGKDGTASHGSVGGILRDVEKINEAQVLGWKVFRVNAKTIQNGQAFTLADRVLSHEQ